MDLISIITINLNNASGLKNTLESVAKQTYRHIELIVVDGCSVDESVDVISAYSFIITKCIIEKDDGLYYAMNKGISLAKGDFALFLNSGDVFENINSLMNVCAKVVDKNLLYFGRVQNMYKSKVLYLTPNQSITLSNYQKWLLSATPCHQSILFPRSFYKKNYYNIEYKICSDVDYKYRAIKQCGCIFVDSIIVNFELGGISTIPNSLRLVNQIVREGYLVRKINFGVFFDLDFLKSIINQYIKYILFSVLGEKRYFKFLKKKLDGV
jgi:putative colanic acid biosynthesis glycosyltransferase